MRGTFLVLKKEIIEFVKDRKTMVFMAFPLLLYPVLFGMMNTLGKKDATQRKANLSRLVLVDPNGTLKEVFEKEPRDFRLVDEPSNLPKAIADDQVDLKVVVAPDAASLRAQGRTFQITAQYDQSTPASKLALDRMKKLFEVTRTRWVEERFHASGNPQEMATPFRVQDEHVGDPGQILSKIMGMMLPYILLISMFAASMQSGAYMSAGERERGTLMSLLATRLSRRDIILGKQLALFLLSIVQAVIQIVGMALGMGRIGIQEAAQIPAGQAPTLGAMADPKVLLLTLLLLVPLGLLFTAIVMLVGIQSRNTREATTALTPGIFVVVFMGMFAMAPGVEKMAALPWVPLVNVLVAIRKLFAQQLPAMEYMVALGMTVLLAAAMTALATRILNRESVLFKA